MTFDLILTGGAILDGTGKSTSSGCIGVRDGKIEAIGDLGDAEA